MRNIFGIEISDNEFDYLISEQSKGKDLKVVDGKVVAVDHTPSQEEIFTLEYNNLINWFNGYYTVHEQQYRRLHTLGDSTAYNKLIALYNEAEDIRKRIQELEVKLDSAK